MATNPAPDLDQAVLGLARQNLAAYMALVHRTDSPDLAGGWAVPSDHHMKIITALMDESLGNTLIVAPRDSAKTFLLQGFVEWTIGRASLTEDKHWAEQLSILYLCHDADAAVKVSNAAKNTIEGNEVYHVLFPKVKKYEHNWGQELWRVRGNEKMQHPTFQASGIGSPPLGGRFKYIIPDDVADAENMKTPTQRATLHHTLSQTVMPMLLPPQLGGRMIMVGTRWAYDDPPAWAQKRGFKEVYLKAIEYDEEGNERSWYPARYSLEFLRELRDKDSDAFSRQYMNEVAPDEGLVFKREWFLDRFEAVPARIILMLNSWDTAASKGRNRSYSACPVLTITPDWDIYLVGLVRDQLEYSELREAVRATAEYTGANYVLIEKASSGHSLINEDRLKGLNVIPCDPFGQKGSPSRFERNSRIAEVCRTGRFHLPSEYLARKLGFPGWLGQVELELFSYPEPGLEGDYDIVDALCQAFWWIEDLRVAGMKLLQRPRQAYKWGESRERKVIV